MAANYRYWCGECSYRTPWLPESRGAAQQARHYAQRHGSVPPGGRVEVRAKRGEGGGCVWLVGVLFLVLLLASTCREEARSAPAPCHPCAEGKVGYVSSPEASRTGLSVFPAAR